MNPLVLFLLACATVYVGAIEAAFSVLMRLSLRLLAERNGRAVGLDRYLDDPLLLFIPVRITLGILIVAATVTAAAMTGLQSFRAAGLLLALVAGIVVLCGHVLPVLIVRQDPERALEILLPPFNVVVRLLRPVSSPLIRVMNAVRRERAPLPGGNGGEAAAAEEGDPAHAYLAAGEQQGLIESEERALLQSIVDFGDTLVREVMTPRPDIVAIPVNATLEELRALLREQEYSRLVVYNDSLDNIIGFVLLKDVFRLEGAGPGDRLLPRLTRPAHVVPETKRVAELLKEFQRSQVQAAIVVDEYGGTAGLVTLEDLLEEIVGEIRDEYDVETEPIVDEGNGAYVVSGKVDVDAIAERLGVTIEREGFETVGGYLMSHLGRVPSTGERLEIDGLQVDVLETERRRIHKVRFRRLPSVVAEERASGEP